MSASILIPGVAVAVSTQIVTAEADVFVFAGNLENNANNIDLLQAGIGRGRQVGQMLTYIRFDVTNVPQSSWFRKTQITRGTVSLLAQSLGLAGVDSRFFVSIAACSNSDWAEDAMTWSSRVCPELARANDIIMIDGTDLPQLYRWDVTRSIAEAVQRRRPRLTLIVSAFKLQRLSGGEREIVPGERFGPKESVGFVRFWSRERMRLGGTAVPTVMLTYEQQDTELTRFGKTMSVQPKSSRYSLL